MKNMNTHQTEQRKASVAGDLNCKLGNREQPSTKRPTVISYLAIGLCAFGIATSPAADLPQGRARDHVYGPTEGLVALYCFEDNLADSSGNGHDGTAPGGATFEPGKVGKALRLPPFNGVPTYVEVKNSSLLSLSNAISICAWVNPGEALGNAFFPIVTKGIEKEDYTLWLTKAGPDLLLNLGGEGFWPHTENEPDTEVKEGIWTHVAATYDGAKVRYYLNGNLKRESEFNKTIETSGEDLFIGISLPGNRERYSGLLDEVRIYSRALAGEEVPVLAGQ
jgi:hypothetical protein